MADNENGGNAVELGNPPVNVAPAPGAGQAGNPIVANPFVYPGAGMAKAYQLLESYDGTSRVKDYIEKVETIRVMFGLSDVEIRQLVSLKLTGKAKNYLDSEVEIKLRGTWAQLQRSLIERFKVETTLQQAEQDFHNIRQRNGETVREYAERVRRSALKTVTYGEDEEINIMITRQLDEKVLRVFEAGLLPSLKTWVMSREPRTMEEAKRFAIKHEQIESMSAKLSHSSIRSISSSRDSSASREERSRPRYDNKGKRPSKKPWTRKEETTDQASTSQYTAKNSRDDRRDKNTERRQVRFFDSKKRDKQYTQQSSTSRDNYNRSVSPRDRTRSSIPRVPRCYNCQKMGHMKNECRGVRVIQCFKCHRNGHYANECTSRTDQYRAESPRPARTLNSCKGIPEVREMSRSSMND